MIRLLDNGSGMDRETVEKINTVGFTRDDSFAIANIKKKAGALLRFSGWYSIQEPFRKGYLCKNQSSGNSSDQ